MYFDSHAHISSSKRLYRDIEGVLERCKQQEIAKVVDSAVDLRSSQKALELAKKFPDTLIPTLGLHPELLIPGSDLYMQDESDRSRLVRTGVGELEKIYKKGKDLFKAVGECGLDYYWVERSNQLTADSHQKKKIKEQQRQLFVSQIKFAESVGLPLVVHSRGAEEECYELIGTNAANGANVLFHSFTGTSQIAMNIIKAGYYISFNGILTYPSAQGVREVFELVWSENKSLILAETDAPFLAPQVKRGQRCEPADVRFVAEKMAEVAGENLKKVAKIVFENSKRYYDIF